MTLHEDYCEVCRTVVPVKSVELSDATKYVCQCCGHALHTDFHNDLFDEDEDPEHDDRLPNLDP